ncbi:hypothetical protein [Sphingomonas azotifigens]|uniref:hypothetical protein n=1 Tax=Sphingomonas azotifigens TaxID=330920 RepID=UPI000A008575|nr:hypothetical protein [Sphingomonas azotifigens]
MVVAVPVMVVLAVGGLDAPEPQGIAPQWRTLATAAPASPVAGDPDVLRENWVAPDGRAASVAVALPRAKPGGLVVQVVPGGNDAAAIEAAAARLRAAGGGVLAMTPGLYRIPVTPDRAGVTLQGLRDVTIAGNGAIVQFDGWGRGLVIRNSSRVAVRGLSFGYTQPAVLAGTVRRTAAATLLDFDDGQQLPTAGAQAYQLSVLFGAQGLYGGGRSRYIFYRDPRVLTPAGGRRYAIEGLPAQLPDGTRVAVKLTAYLGSALVVGDSPGQPVSNDIVFDHVTVRNSPGMGLFVERMGRGLAVVASHFGVPGASAATIAYDGLHVSGVAGDILLRDNQITRTGDDAINLASPLFEASATPQGPLTVRLRGGGLSPGAEAALFDAELSYLARGTVTGREMVPGPGAVAHVQIAASGFRAADVRYVRDLGLLGNRYAIVNNAIGACECHAILAQGPNGLVRGNRMTDIGFNAIKVVTSAFWKEGAGAQNLIVEDNVIAGTGEDVRRDIVAAAIMVYAEGAGTPPGLLPASVHAGLILRRNRIAGRVQGCISIASATNVVIERNACGRPVQAQSVEGAVGASLPEVVQAIGVKASHMFDRSAVWIDPYTTKNIHSADNAEQ